MEAPEPCAKNIYVQGTNGRMNVSKPSDGGGVVDKSEKSGIIKTKDISISKSKLTMTSVYNKGTGD